MKVRELNDILDGIRQYRMISSYHILHDSSLCLLMCYQNPMLYIVYELVIMMA